MAVLTRSASKNSDRQSQPPAQMPMQTQTQIQIQIQVPPRPPQRQGDARRSIRSRCPTPYPQVMPPVQASERDGEEDTPMTDTPDARRTRRTKSALADENVATELARRRSRRNRGSHSNDSHDGHDGLKNATLARRRSKMARRAQAESQRWQDKMALRSRGATVFACPGILYDGVDGEWVLQAPL